MALASMAAAALSIVRQGKSMAAAQMLDFYGPARNFLALAAAGVGVFETAASTRNSGPQPDRPARGRATVMLGRCLDIPSKKLHLPAPVKCLGIIAGRGFPAWF